MNSISLLLIVYSVLAPGIKDYFKTFPFKPENITIDKEDEHTRITIDEKNAYIMISYDDPDYSFEYGGEIEFTYFVCRSPKQYQHRNKILHVHQSEME
jgi:hypothetical protein